MCVTVWRKIMNLTGKNNRIKTAIFIAVFIILNTTPVFGQASSVTKSLTGLNTALATILGFFTSGYMKAILSIALGGLAIGLIVNRGEQGVVKKFIPWIAACVLLLSLSAITGIIFTPTGTEIQPAPWN
jgi:hypothetical protein